jgi:hypothetical protein
MALALLCPRLVSPGEAFPQLVYFPGMGIGKIILPTNA